MTKPQLVLIFGVIISGVLVVSTGQDELCEDGWKNYGNHCYKASTAKKEGQLIMLSWVEARAKCHDLGAELISILDEEEMNFTLVDILGKTCGNYWIGLSNLLLTRGYSPFHTLYWSDGSQYNHTELSLEKDGPEYRFPLCSDISMYQGHIWDMAHCEEIKNWICKRPTGNVSNLYCTAINSNIDVSLITDAPSFILSPNYPFIYQVDTMCQWLVQSDTSLGILVIFEYMELMGYYDYIAITATNNSTDELSDVVVYGDRQVKSVVFASNIIKIETRFQEYGRPDVDKIYFDNDDDGDDAQVMVDHGIGFQLRVMSNSTNQSCANHTFDCGNGICVSNSSRCNAINDCGNHQDEMACRYGPNLMIPTCTHWDNTHDVILKYGITYVMFPPNYPLRYPDYLNCTWFIRAEHEQDYYVHFAIQNLNLLGTNDILQIGDGTVPGRDILVTLDEEIRNEVGIASKTGSTWVHFTSDADLTKMRGFFMRVVLLKNLGYQGCIKFGFGCLDGSCVSDKAVCDGFDDCPDKSDEIDCKCVDPIDYAPLARVLSYCAMPLGLEDGLIMDTDISASSYLNNSSLPHFARLNHEHAWLPTQGDSEPWLQVHFQQRVITTFIAFQTPNTDIENIVRVSSILLNYSSDGLTWKKKNVDFPNSLYQTRSTCPKLGLIEPGIQANFIRMLIPKELFGNQSSYGLRFEIYGCYDNECSYTVYRAERGNNVTTVSSNHSTNRNTELTANVKIYGAPYHAQGWVPDQTGSDHWFQITFHGIYKVGAIVTQGCGNVDFWVYNYTIKYSRTSVEDLISYRDLTNSTAIKVFKGNTDRTTRSWSFLNPHIEATFLRLIPLTWHRFICLRVEVLGCNKTDPPICGIHNPANTFPRECLSNNAIIKTPGYPNPHSSDTYNIIWNIKVPYGNYVKITFKDFDIPSDGECSVAYLKIKENFEHGMNEDLSVYLCNENYRDQIIKSRFNSTQLQLQHTYQHQKSGFEAEYMAQKFVTSVHSKHGNDKCDRGWRYFDGFCYLLRTETTTTDLKWIRAQSICNTYNATLASIHNQETSDFLHQLVIDEQFPPFHSWYIGLYYNSTNRLWQWIDGRPLIFTDWFQGVEGSYESSVYKKQPDDNRPGSCSVLILASIYSTAGWHDVPCAFQNAATSYMCMKPAITNEPTESGGEINPDFKTGNSSANCGDVLYTCRSGECIQKSYVCDDVRDCRDSSDEDVTICRSQSDFKPQAYDEIVKPSKTSSCLADQWRCDLTGKCISVHQFCDFKTDCPSGYDEQCDYPRCKEDEFECSNKQCISEEKRCDLIHDCLDGSDEDKCETNINGFLCYSGEFIPITARCNGQKDCDGDDGEDEKHCQYQTPCNSILCKNGACVNNSLQCQYGKDKFGYPIGCPDATHLEGCDKFACDNATTFKCNNSYCVPIENVCDGVLNCPNGEEEKGCDNYICTEKYSCRNSKVCVIMEKLCDGVKHCPDGDDELYCDLECPLGCECRGLFYECHNVEWDHSKADLIPREIRSFNLTKSNTTDTREYNETIASKLFIDLKTMENLIILDLSFNGIQHILPETFVQNQNMRYLRLAGNQISDLNSNIFDDLSRLEHLVLNENPLSAIQANAFIGLNRLWYLNIQKELEASSINLIGDGLLDQTKLPQLQTLHSDNFLFCCLLNEDRTDTSCLPEPDQFSSCKDLMRNSWYRIFMWILGFSALLGNGFVIGWRILPMNTKQSRTNGVQSLLVLNLAIADSFMGIYMIIIASADKYYRGEYIFEAEAWQTSSICKFAGFLSVLSSEASVVFLTVISLDRWMCITFPFSNKKLDEYVCKIVIVFVWFFCIVISLIPMLVTSYFGDKFYGQSSVCLALPLSQEHSNGWEYSIALFLGLNLLGFTIMIFCYISIFVTAKSSSSKISNRSGNVRREQIELATRMAFLVSTDFICWFPIIVMGILSAAGAATISGDVYVLVAVFVLPINSSLNPYLYTILTREMSRRQAQKKSSKATSKQLLSSSSAQGDSSNDGFALSNTDSDVITATVKELRCRRVLPYMVNDKLESMRLTKYIYDNDATLNESEILVIMQDLEKAYDYFKDNDIVHGHITEHNVFVEKTDNQISGVFIMMPSFSSKPRFNVAVESDQSGYDNAALTHDDSTGSEQGQVSATSSEHDKQMLQDLIILLNKTLVK